MAGPCSLDTWGLYSDEIDCDIIDDSDTLFGGLLADSSDGGLLANSSDDEDEE